MGSRRIAAVVSVVSAIYYILLSSRQFTWIFGSGDSGDFLAAAKSWLPPQPFGNPVYVLFGHLLDAFPGDLVVKMTIVGNCLASAVTVAVVFLIAQKMTQSTKIGLLAAATLLASPVFLSQATVLSQYPLAILATVLAFWFALTGHRKLAVVCLGVGTAMHVIVAGVAMLWLVVEWTRGNIREWLRVTPLYLAVGVLPYSLTLWELWRYHGTLNLGILAAFVGNTAGAGELAALDFPARLFWFACFVLTGLGVTLPLVWSGIRWSSEHRALLLTPIAFVSWYYLTARDPTTWHYLPWTMPFLVVLAGLGIRKMASVRWVIPAVAASALVLVATNAVFLNAGVETARNPVAMDTYRQFANLPQGSVVDVPDTGWVGFAFRYVQVNERPDLRRQSPVIMGVMDTVELEKSGYLEPVGRYSSPYISDLAIDNIVYSDVSAAGVLLSFDTNETEPLVCEWLTYPSDIISGGDVVVTDNKHTYQIKQYPEGGTILFRIVDKNANRGTDWVRFDLPRPDKPGILMPPYTQK